MNMMEFVKLFRKVDGLEATTEMILDVCRKLAKNQKLLRTGLFLAGIDFLCVWGYISLNEKEMKDLRKRVHELEVHNDYMNATVEEAPEMPGDGRISGRFTWGSDDDFDDKK